MWTEGRDGRPNTTSAEAIAALKRWLRLVRRHGSNEPAMMALANAVERHPLRMNAASPAFMWVFQRFMVKQFAQALAGDDRAWSVISVVDRQSGAKPGRLRADIFEQLDAKLHDALHAAGIRNAMGGFDLSANEHQHDAFDPHYRPQAWIFVPTKEIRAGERILRQSFLKSPRVPRPVVIKPWDGNMTALAYALKPDFYRRVSLEAGNTRKCELRASQKVEIALAMHKAGPDARLFLHGFEMDVTGDIRPSRRSH